MQRNIRKSIANIYIKKKTSNENFRSFAERYLKPGAIVLVLYNGQTLNSNTQNYNFNFSKSYFDLQHGLHLVVIESYKNSPQWV